MDRIAAAVGAGDAGMLPPVNLLTCELDEDQTRPGFRWRGADLGRRFGAALSGARLYDLGDGQVSFPYHFHYGIEEWLFVVSGEPRLRSPDGQRRVSAGELVRFPAGPGGAHALTGPGRVLIFGDRAPASMVVYPDSDKIGTRPRDTPTDRLNFPRTAGVDYWEGE